MYTREIWTAAHPFLKSIADLEKIIDGTIKEIEISKAATPTWSEYLDDFKSGVPALHSAKILVDLHQAPQCIAPVMRCLTVNKSLPATIAVQMQRLTAEFERDKDWPSHAVGWLLGREPLTATSNPGLLRYVGWAVLRRYLCDVLESYSLWRDEEFWLREYCPTCGAVPALAHLTGSEPARIRVLVCGFCLSRWRYRRMGCPFCGNADDRQLSTLSCGQLDPLRIDHCKICNGYTKTYTAEGDESVFLADWTSLHLDVIARDYGFERYAGSLYQI